MSQAIAPAGAVQYLSFQLGGLEYALECGKVSELRQLKSLERFAADGEIVMGVAVSRGVIMPIVDMRTAIGGVRPPLEPDLDVIILALSHCVTATANSSPSMVGVVVDGVTDAVWLLPSQIEAIAGAAGVDYLIGVGRCGERRLVLIDIERLMSVRSPATAPVTAPAMAPTAARDGADSIRPRGLLHSR